MDAADDIHQRGDLHRCRPFGGKDGVAVRVTYDRGVDMAYLYLVEIEPGGVAYTEALIVDLPAGRRLINLDFDGEGRLVGIEIDGGSFSLPHQLLDEATDFRA